MVRIEQSSTSLPFLFLCLFLLRLGLLIVSMLVLLDSDALQLQSNSPDLLTLRGLVLFLCGRLPQALLDAQSALRYDPGYEPAQRLRKRVKEVERLKEDGNQAFKVGKLQEALTLYTDALEVRPLAAIQYSLSPFDPASG
jgi:tetratricopeptide (TPR) repeat protein